jgi:hypothetical protein
MPVSTSLPSNVLPVQHAASSTAPAESAESAAEAGAGFAQALQVAGQSAGTGIAGARARRGRRPAVAAPR